MKNLLGILAIAASLISSCATPSYQTAGSGNEYDPPVTQSLFTGKNTTISEENIQ